MKTIYSTEQLLNEVISLKKQVAEVQMEINTLLKQNNIPVYSKRRRKYVRAKMIG